MEARAGLKSQAYEVGVSVRESQAEPTTPATRRPGHCVIGPIAGTVRGPLLIVALASPRVLGLAGHD